jgi:hypothetical protein
MSEKKAAKAAKPPAKKAARGGKAGEDATLAKVAAMPEGFRDTGKRLHALILRSAPALQPTVWYGMPGYAKDGKTVCFFRADKKYMTFGFTQEANLGPEEGARRKLMECAWFFTALDDADEAELAAMVRRVAR